MATTVSHTGYGSSMGSLTTALNTLANNTNSAASSSIANSTSEYLFADVVLDLAVQGSARSAGALVLVYLLPSWDGGTTFARLNETTAELWASFTLDAATTATKAVVRDCGLPPGNFEIFARNQTGQAFAASGNTINIYPHNILQT